MYYLKLSLKCPIQITIWRLLRINKQISPTNIERRATCHTNFVRNSTNQQMRLWEGDLVHTDPGRTPLSAIVSVKQSRLAKILFLHHRLSLTKHTVFCFCK